MLRVLIVEDESVALAALAKLVEREGFRVTVAPDLSRARELLRDDPPQVVITDLQLPDGSGLELVRENPTLEVVLVTGHATVETAVEALRAGAFDFLTKPIDVGHLKRVLNNLVRAHRMRGEIGALREELKHLGRFGRLIGGSPAMQRVYELLQKVGPTEAPVLLTGESGTGKEVAAMTLHDLSARKDRPFLALNCGAVAPNMIESELFGHERGSFTGAMQKHVGYFERAAGGTLLLDEITEMLPEYQVKLLRVLETRRVTRVGGEKEFPIDVRIVAATNRSPDEAVSDGKLRQDLFYRLKVFQIALPPLRERGDDVPLLAEQFLRGLNQEHGTEKSFTKQALARLAAHTWPGNVRELRNIVHAAYILGDQDIGAECVMLDAEDLARAASAGAPEPAVELRTSPAPAAKGDAPVIEVQVGMTAAQAEQKLVLATLAYCNGNKNRAAQMLDLSLKTMYNRLKLYQEPGSAS